ncbi:LuxR C-terminal-related transcriptional regulator [Paenibacillus sp. GYB003]|uniref:LuxR C-terminal-related transcriptional regulator n=1 Tax=Paenibacillus sp. GYB003 TaxID=2994392 RepID=UPI002F9668B3
MLILTSQPDDELIVQAMMEGASGFLLKDWETDDIIIRAIKSVVSGQMTLPARISARLSEGLSRLHKQQSRLDEDEIMRRNERLPWERLDVSFSLRERQIICLLMQEHTNSDIADLLHLSVGTVKKLYQHRL